VLNHGGGKAQAGKGMAELAKCRLNKRIREGSGMR